jgi:glutaminyl-tRNA synthetase
VPRRVAVLDPLKLIIDNYPANQQETCEAPNHPQKPEWGKRAMPFSGELWIEREDFTEMPPKGYFRLFPGNTVRLRHGFVVKCTGCDKDGSGNVTAVHCEYFPDSKSGTSGSDNYKVKGNIHWLCAKSAGEARVHLYDRLFRVEHPGSDRDFLEDLNPESRSTITARVEPSLGKAATGESFQFERHGYFTVDRTSSNEPMPVFNRTVTLRDGWAKQKN